MRCEICPRLCSLTEGKAGFCGQMEARDGVVVPGNYGNIVALALDPVEKKPLYHFTPGKMVLSIGSSGCNLSCKFCQNWHISQKSVKGKILAPRDVVDEALAVGAAGIAYTYNEPTVWFEYVHTTAALAREAGLRNVCVTNGYINPEPLRKWLKVIDAFNVDLKSMSDEFYRTICQGSLLPVLRSIESISREKHVEITTLVIPGLNDSSAEMKRIALFLSKLSPAVPLHLTRYFPRFGMSIEPTPLTTLESLREVSLEYLNYVYIGNTTTLADTYCPACASLILERASATFASRVTFEEDRVMCPCGEEIKIIV